MEPVPDSIGIGSVNYATPGIGPTRSIVTRSITSSDLVEDVFKHAYTLHDKC